MPIDKQSLPVPITPVTVTMVGTGAGNGNPIPSGTTLVTPDHQPNVIVKVVQPIVAISIRFANTFLTVLLGVLMGAMGTDVIQADDFLHLVYKCAGLSVAGAGMGLIKDLITVFGNLEKSNPLLTGSV
jgi:hypothetical protein